MSAAPAAIFARTLGIEVPLICGPMYPCSNPELVAAVSEAGGIGVVQPISLTYVHGHAFRDGLRYIRQLTSKPIGFNALIEASSRLYLQRMMRWVEIALEEGVHFFITSLGNPKWVVDRVHAAGGVVYHDVTERKWAQKARDGSFGEPGQASDLEARQLAAAQSHDAGDAEAMGRPRGGSWTGRTIPETRKPLGAEAREPLESGAFGDCETRGDDGDGLAELEDAVNHLRSTPRREFGLTVNVHAALESGLVLLSQPHLPKSSPHEQRPETSQLGAGMKQWKVGRDPFKPISRLSR